MPRFSNGKWYLLDGEEVWLSGASFEVKDGKVPVEIGIYIPSFWDGDLADPFEVAYILEGESYRIGILDAEEYTQMLEEAAEAGQTLDDRPGWEPPS